MAMRKREPKHSDSRRERDNGPELGGRKRSRHLDNVQTIDINDADFLQRLVTEQGKILPSRLTGATAKQQRVIKRGIRRARNVGLVM